LNDGSGKADCRVRHLSGFGIAGWRRRRAV
jgi:hypothetical protein